MNHVKLEFLNYWCGSDETPSEWLQRVVATTQKTVLHTPFDSEPYLGERSLESGDRYGPDRFPVGREACARRGCMGCCFCLYDPAPELHVNVTVSDDLLRCGHRSFWLTVEQLEQMVRDIVIEDVQACKELFEEPVPTILLDRTEPLSWPHGRVVQISGFVRQLVSASRLQEWKAFLADATLLQVLVSDADACDPSVDEEAACQDHLTRWRAMRDTRGAEQAAVRDERAQLNALALHEARKGCGSRIGCESGIELNSKPAIGMGDLVYYDPPSACERTTTPTVGIVTKVHYHGGTYGQGFGSLPPILSPSGEIDLAVWSTSEHKFCTRNFVSNKGFILMPPCCGRGARCPHLASQDPALRQWPNGDPLDLDDLKQCMITWKNTIKEAAYMTWRRRPTKIREQKTKSALDAYASILSSKPRRVRGRETAHEDGSCAQRKKLKAAQVTASGHGAAAPESSTPEGESCASEEESSSSSEGESSSSDDESFWDTLTFKYMGSSDEASDIAARDTAIRGLEDYNHPEFCCIRSSPYLLDGTDLIAGRAPDVWRIWLWPFEISSDGSQVTRQVAAQCKLRSEKERTRFNATDDPTVFFTSRYLVRDEITYTFPTGDDAMARSRALKENEEMEHALIRRLQSACRKLADKLEGKATHASADAAKRRCKYLYCGLGWSITADTADANQNTSDSDGDSEWADHNGL